MTARVKCIIMFSLINFIYINLLMDVVRGVDLPNKSKILPFSRESVEEIEENISLLPCTQQADPRSHLVSLLVKNVKEIFGSLDEPTTEDEAVETESPVNMTTDSTTSKEPSIKRRASVITTEIDISDNVSLDTSNALEENTETTSLSHLSKDLILLGQNEESEEEGAETDGETLKPSSTIAPSNFGSGNKSCIFCNNVETPQCNNPQYKLIPSIICERDDDLCYSMHTPFGVIDRGCFNVNHNLTTYVCSCNLCNYISITELPHMFSTMHDWVNNVIELSRTRNLRKSVFKDMSCIRCEVNATSEPKRVRENTNCLEGNVANLPIQECQEREICAVMSIKSTGYIWRGCVENPRYNNWWILCDTDLCNYETHPSLYHPV